MIVRTYVAEAVRLVVIALSLSAVYVAVVAMSVR